ncbi:unnamed protein product [Eruca vesicaria subsp. sativa]|uniref:Uncharacterized protein n=1 Tax=Eruca vesicaria subsp. sativa TaxID=29727 RepID=A0ABC8IZW1_ERUVS|nr:unnamed protein product [Eruca vesicaria subsp. sativa]
MKTYNSAIATQDTAAAGTEMLSSSEAMFRRYGESSSDKSTGSLSAPPSRITGATNSGSLCRIDHDLKWLSLDESIEYHREAHLRNTRICEGKIEVRIMDAPLRERGDNVAIVLQGTHANQEKLRLLNKQ